MSNRVTITFEFSGMGDGDDSDLVEDAISCLEQIVENLGGYTVADLQVETNGVGGPDRPLSVGLQADVTVVISRGPS